ncbi:MAG: hypothetical protein KBD56_00895 [Candidatus Eisenbacteria bacterium]|nr:hypothetical protein [Candidatus Eisenbacteria bacterium]
MARRIGVYSMPLSAVKERLCQERMGTWDEYGSLSDLRMEVRDSLAPLGSRFKILVRRRSKTIETFPTGHCMQQICGLLRMPGAFLDRLPAAVGLKLLRTLQETSELSDGRALLMRFQGRDHPTFRAILPSSYVRMDDLDILDIIQQAAGASMSSLQTEISDDSLTLRLAMDDKDMLLNVGSLSKKDPAAAGISIMTSETGAHPLEIRHLLLRLICINGVTVPIDGQKMLSRRFVQTDRATIAQAILGTIEAVSTRAGVLAARLSETHAQMVPDPAAEIRAVFHRDRLGNPSGRLGRWVTSEVDRQMSLFGARRFEVVQAFTAVARGLEAGDRLRLEDAMGRYVMEGAEKN